MISEVFSKLFKSVILCLCALHPRWCCTGWNMFHGFSDMRNEPDNQAEAEGCRGRAGIEYSTGHSDLLLGQGWEFVCNLLYNMAVSGWKCERGELLSGFALTLSGEEQPQLNSDVEPCCPGGNILEMNCTLRMANCKGQSDRSSVAVDVTDGSPLSDRKLDTDHEEGRREHWGGRGGNNHS